MRRCVLVAVLVAVLAGTAAYAAARRPERHVLIGVKSDAKANVCASLSDPARIVAVRDALGLRKGTGFVEADYRTNEVRVSTSTPEATIRFARQLPGVRSAVPCP